jgi:hypothetical protein
LREEPSPEEAALQTAEAFFEPEAAQALNQGESADTETAPAADEK